MMPPPKRNPNPISISFMKKKARTSIHLSKPSNSCQTIEKQERKNKHTEVIEDASQKNRDDGKKKTRKQKTDQIRGGFHS